MKRRSADGDGSPLEAQTDAELLAAVGAGDRQALEELYLSYYPRLARFLSRSPSRYQNAEHVINDTFMSVWQCAKDFRHPSRVSIWIFGMAYRMALTSLLHQKSPTAATGLDECLEDTVGLVDAEVQDGLAQGLEILPLQQRLTLKLAYQMGFSLEEIAAITDTPVDTVKARMYHAREMLRLYLTTLGKG
jgi:RNA polymerase sigma-70 factor (ECF subfamily)